MQGSGPWSDLVRKMALSLEPARSSAAAALLLGPVSAAAVLLLQLASIPCLYTIVGISAAVGTVEGVSVAVGTVCQAATFGFVNGAILKHEIVYKETKKKYCEFSPVITVWKSSKIKIKPINIPKMK